MVDLSSKNIDKLIDKISNALGCVFSPAAQELSHLLGDQMRLWRFQNGARILRRAEETIEERGLTPDELRKLPYGEQFLVLEKATFEDKPEIQEMWAQLIANALDPDSNVHIEKRILELLTSLSPPEAGLLHVLKVAGTTPASASRQAIDEFIERIDTLANKYWRHHPDEIRNACAQNLVRLRCIGIRTDNTGVASGVLARLPPEMQGGTRSRHDWCAIDPAEFKSLIAHIDKAIRVNAGIAEIEEHQNSFLISGPTSIGWLPPIKVPVPELTYMLTPLGSELVEACIADQTDSPISGGEGSEEHQ